MTLREAYLEIDAANRDNLTETGGLAEIKGQCEKEADFSAKLSDRFGWTPEKLLNFIDESIAEIRSHHARMQRGNRRMRW